MYRVVLGGGISSGKSTVGRMLAELGALVVDLDEIAAEVRRDPAFAARIAERFGDDVLDDGVPIPSILAARAFLDQQSTRDLEAILHPEIIARSMAFLMGEDDAPSIAGSSGEASYENEDDESGPTVKAGASGAGMRVVMVPLVTLADDLLAAADEVVVVQAPEDLRLERAVARGMDLEDVRKRISRQAGVAEEVAVADTIISNSGSIDELRSQVESWWRLRTGGSESISETRSPKPPCGRDAVAAQGSGKRKRRGLKALVALAVAAALIWFVGLPIAERVYYRLDYVEFIQEAAEEHQVNPYWIIAMVKCESDFDPEAVSSAGAVGLMQIMEETAEEIAQRGLVDSERYSPENLTDPETNINYGTAYMRYLVERYHEMNPAIAAYNAGLGNVDEWLENGDDIRGTIEFEETSDYLEAVNRAKEAYERLYPDAFEWDVGQ